MAEPQTFAELWDRSVHDHRDRTFLLFRSTDGEISTWTYGGFDAAVDGVAARLSAYGVGAGDAVHVTLRNCPAFVAVWLAVSRLGAWMVPVDPASSARDVSRQLATTRPVLAVCAAERQDVVCQGVGGHTVPIIGLTETSADLEPGSPLLATARAGLESASPRPQARIAVMFTSGTTSEPKGVELTQHNYRHVATVMADLAGLTRDDRWYVCLPLFHANAQYYCFASAIAVGASVALTARFTASRWPHEVAECGATHASLFAAPIRMILARRRDDAPTLAMKHVWFAQNLAPGQWAAMTDLCGVAPRQIYGMTETLPVVTANPPGEPDPSRIGSVIAGRHVVLLDPVTAEPVQDGEPGVLTLAGRRGVDLFLGYLDNPFANARAFPDLDLTVPEAGQVWFSTGDLARRCADGQLAFVGRIDDVIKVAGENVSLTEVEAALAEAPGVLEAAVVAVPDEMRDHVPVAYVVPSDPRQPPATQLLEDWAATHLSPSARPRTWTVVDALPRTSVGKIRRFRLTPEHQETP
ncbi:class I adenylate-forming enzyme family protein [Nocardia niigatensis]|uniref:class I adenylate-forming enzyme family protein n=1 Tax=Nocardia niigatensis TaxID=209249 RepID=UPI0002DFE86F|nr:class I adenylate-forming enzyme family protein [Nocardia niigatensis]